MIYLSYSLLQSSYHTHPFLYPAFSFALKIQFNLTSALVLLPHQMQINIKLDDKKSVLAKCLVNEYFAADCSRNTDKCDKNLLLEK